MEIAIGLGIGVIIGAVIGVVISKSGKSNNTFDDTQILNVLNQYERDTKGQLNNVIQAFADLKANIGVLNANDKEILTNILETSKQISQNSVEMDKQVSETMNRSQNEFIRTLSTLENTNLESQMKSMEAFKREIGDKFQSFESTQAKSLEMQVNSINSFKQEIGERFSNFEETESKSQNDFIFALTNLEKSNLETQMGAMKKQMESIDSFKKDIGEKLDNFEQNQSRNQNDFIRTLVTFEKNNIESQMKSMDSLTKEIGSKLFNFSVTQQNNSELTLKQLENVRNTVKESLDNIAVTNAKKLDEMREVVDEKLQKTLEDRLQKSFNSVVEQLERVQNGLGEMQTLANDVGNLKKVLSNVKTRGILGEIQLGAILEEILAPEQYETNIVTVSGSSNPVEFAIKLPGNSEDGHVYLPIDSKFPMDTYQHLLDAYELNDKDMVNGAWKQLEGRLKSEAKDIREKYIHVPETTDFAIMFLPTEGLYAEAVRHGMVEILQKEKIMIAGPTTMAALLNSLQMGFKTLAIQKSSSEVWEVLGHVKSEFETFEEALLKTQKHLRTVDSDLEMLVGRRTRAMMRKLKDVTSIESDKSEVVLLSDEIENIE